MHTLTVRFTYKFDSPLSAERTIDLRAQLSSSTNPTFYPAPSTSAASFFVTTCGSGWAFAGRNPLPAVKRGKPFAITVLKSDTAGFPSWKGSGSTNFRTTEMNGNGASDDMFLTSPGISRVGTSELPGAPGQHGPA